MLDFLEEHLPERLRPLLEKARELLPDPEIGQRFSAIVSRSAFQTAFFPLSGSAWVIAPAFSLSGNSSL